MRAINRNKIIAVMAAIVVFMVSMCTYSGETKGANTEREYYVYDAQSGAYLEPRDYTLGAFDTYPNVNSGNARGVIGADTRQPDWTKSGVVKIMTPGGYRGTGFIIGDHEIATAAHCVYKRADSNSGAYSYQINNILLFDTLGNIALQATPVEYHIAENWVISEESDGYDYALITVEEDLSDYPHFELGVCLDSIINENLNAKITGFPDKVRNEYVNTSSIHAMYTGSGKIILMTPTQVVVDTDTTGGNSGGPIYIEESRGNYSYNTAIAILFSGSTNENGEEVGNIGLRFTADHLHFYRNNPNINYE